MIDGIVGRRAGARLPHDLARGRATSTTSTSTSPTPVRSAAASASAARSARSRRRCSSVKLIDWDADVPAVRRLRRLGGGGFYGGPPDPDIATVICRVLDRYNASPKVRLAAFEAAIVESGVHNLNYGDRDSLGVFQQRPSHGLGHARRRS